MKFKFNSALFWVKLIIVVITVIYIIREVFVKGNFIELLLELLVPGENRLFLLLATLILVPVNWGIEAMKWKLLMKDVYPVPFKTAFYAIFSGVTISSWTPNRSGEYIGRMFFLPYKARLKSVFTTIAGNMAQLFLTIFAGSIGTWYYLSHWYEGQLEAPIFNFLNYPQIYLPFLLMINLLFLIFLLKFRHMHKIIPSRFTKLQGLKKAMKALEFYDRTVLWMAILLSAIRFSVFTFQFYLLLLAFDVQVQLLPSFALISLTFFIQALFPLITIMGVVVRGQTAVFLLGVLSDNHDGIIAASYSLWFINLIIPALAGAIFMLFSSSYKPAKND